MDKRDRRRRKKGYEKETEGERGICETRVCDVINNFGIREIEGDEEREREMKRWKKRREERERMKGRERNRERGRKL